MKNAQSPATILMPYVLLGCLAALALFTFRQHRQIQALSEDLDRVDKQVATYRSLSRPTDDPGRFLLLTLPEYLASIQQQCNLLESRIEKIEREGRPVRSQPGNMAVVEEELQVLAYQLTDLEEAITLADSLGAYVEDLQFLAEAIPPIYEELYTVAYEVRNRPR